MSVPENFEVADGYACYRPVGKVSLQQLTDLVADAIAYAAAQNIKRLLVNTTLLTGFQNPTVVDRLVMIEKWAYTSGSVKLAIVARREFIDPERFGVVVARNRGLTGDRFTSEPEAIAWLLSQRAQ